MERLVCIARFEPGIVVTSCEIDRAARLGRRRRAGGVRARDSPARRPGAAISAQLPERPTFPIRVVWILGIPAAPLPVPPPPKPRIATPPPPPRPSTPLLPPP